jgi:hypothetical protein
MAEIAHSYEDQAKAEGGSTIHTRSRRVSFSELVEAWAFRESGTASEDRFQELMEAFVQERGEITDAYICESGPMAVAVTALRPKPLERKLLRSKDKIEMFTETERLVRMHPEVAQILHRAEVQYVSVRNALRGLSQRLLVNWLFVWMRDLMLSAIPDTDGTVTPLTEKQIAEQGRELDRIEEHYEQAASREAQIVYLGGMLGGVLALCAVTVPIGILLAASDVPVNLTTFFGCLIGGPRRPRQRCDANERGQVPRPPRGGTLLRPAGGGVPAVHRRRLRPARLLRAPGRCDPPARRPDRRPRPFRLLPRARVRRGLQRAAGEGGAPLDGGRRGGAG